MINSQHKGIGRFGYLKDRKIGAAQELKKILEGNVGNIHEFSGELSQGNLGKIVKEMSKYMSSNPLKSIEWICFNEKSDKAITPEID